MHPAYSDLEAVRQHDHEGLQVINDHTESSQEICNDTNTIENSTQVAPEQRQILGLKPKRFWSTAAVTLVVIAAAVGGGVGGALSQRDTSRTPAATTNNAPAGAAPTTASSTPTSLSNGPVTSSPTTTAPSLTTTEVPGPTTTLLRDCPSSNNTIYDVTFGGQERLFRKICNMAYLNTINTEVINEKTMNLNDCIDKCAAYNKQESSEIRDGRTNVCNAVCWRNTFDTNFPGQCFGYTTQNSSNGFELRSEVVVCDSAAWINQSFD